MPTPINWWKDYRVLREGCKWKKSTVRMKVITVDKKETMKRPPSIGSVKSKSMPNDHLAFSYFSHFFSPHYFFSLFIFSRFFHFIITLTFFTCKSGRQIQHAWQPPPHAKFKPIGLYNERGSRVPIRMTSGPFHYAFYSVVQMPSSSD